MSKQWLKRILKSLIIGLVAGSALVVAVTVIALGPEGASDYASARIHSIQFAAISVFVRLNGGNRDKTEAQIHRAVIRDVIQHLGWPWRTPLAIRRLTIEPPGQVPQSCFEKEPPGQDMVLELEQVSAQTALVAENLDIQLPYSLVNPYGTLAPENFISVSRPAFGLDKNRALVYFEVSGLRYGGGFASYAVYGKGHDGWVVLDGCVARQ